MSSGFVAGTLVHTDKGLVPIQNLQADDLVLTKDGLKPVLKVVKSQNKERIYKLQYFNETADKNGQKGINYIFCQALTNFWVSKKPNNQKGGWQLAENLAPIYFNSINGDVLSMDDYKFMPVRTLPNFPLGCAYFQTIEHHDEGWDDVENIEFVRFKSTGYQFVSVADTAEDYENEMITLNAKTNDSKLHINPNSPFLVDAELYKTLNVRLRQDMRPILHNVRKYEAYMNSPLIINGRIVTENRIGDENLFRKAMENIEKYGDATGLTEKSLHEQMENYDDICPNPYLDHVYNLEVTDNQGYFVGYDGVLVKNSTIQGITE